MTTLNVVSTLTTIPGSGKIVVSDVDLAAMTVGEVKMIVEESTGVSVVSQKLWWRGYVLDDMRKPLTEACVGVNKGEKIDASLDSLVIFMTVDIEPKDRMVRIPSSPSFRRIRSPSLDLDKVRQEFPNNQRKCVVS